MIFSGGIEAQRKGPIELHVFRVWREFRERREFERKTCQKERVGLVAISGDGVFDQDRL